MKRSTVVVFTLACVQGCAAHEQPQPEFRSVQPVCIEEAPAAGAWACGEVRVVSCEEAIAADQELHVELAEGCDDADLQAVDGPFGPGEHEIMIEDAASDAVVCTATLEVLDDDLPLVDTVEVNLWPPNHKMHEITLADCIGEVVDCDPDWTARIVAVSSDEPDNDRGDGNTEADIQRIADDSVALRSERQGGSNGRVYTIDFEVVDGSENVAEARCYVTVVHDQSGAAAIDDGPAHTVDWTD